MSTCIVSVEGSEESCLLALAQTGLMSPSTMPKTACQVKAWIANTTLFGAIALVVVLLCIPVVVFLVFRDSDSANWQDSLSPLSLLLGTCDSQSAGNTVSGC